MNHNITDLGILAESELPGIGIRDGFRVQGHVGAWIYRRSIGDLSAVLFFVSLIPIGCLQLLGNRSAGPMCIDRAIYIDDRYYAATRRGNENFVDL